MRVIITGGTGLIGRALSASLVSDGHHVIVLSRSPARAPAGLDGAQLVRWDAHTPVGWGHLVDGADAIVNLAGAPLNKRWTPAYKRIIRQSRLDAGHAVVAAVEKAASRPRAVIQASGVGYYGPRRDKVVTEGADPGDGFLGQTAVAWEASTAPVQEFGVRRAIIRSGVVFTTAGGALPLIMLPFRFFVGGPLGTGDQWVPWIHVADEVRAIRFLIRRPDAVGPFNLTSPDLVTNAEFSLQLARAMDRPVLLRVPSSAVRLALGEMSTVVLDGQRAIPKKLGDLGFEFRFPSTVKALHNLLS